MKQIPFKDKTVRCWVPSKKTMLVGSMSYWFNATASSRVNPLPFGVWTEGTGIPDKHGKEIFDQDIIKQRLQNEFGSKEEQIGLMEWSEEHMCWGIKYNTNAGYKFVNADAPEIIGDIFQHPELIKCQTCDGEKKITHNAGHDDERTEPCPDCVGRPEEPDYSGASGNDR